MFEKHERIIIGLAVSISAIILVAIVIWRVAIYKPAPQIPTEHLGHDLAQSQPLTESSDQPAKHPHTEYQRREVPKSKPLAESGSERAKTNTEPAAGPKMSLNDVIRIARTWQPAHSPWYGKPAPDFTLTDIAGKQHKLSNYRGRNVMIIFWATWCRPCHAEIPHLIALRNIIGEDKLAMLAISNENPSLVKKFVADKKINYTVLSNPGAMPPPYSQIRGIPSSFFIDPDGKIKLATSGLLSLGEIKAILQAPLEARNP